MPKMLTADNLVADFVEDAKISPEDSDIANFKKWALEALCELELVEDYEEEVKLVRIKDYKAQKPDDMVVLCEIAAKELGNKSENEECRIIGYQVKQWKQDLPTEGCELEINLLCNACKKTQCNCNSAGYSIDIDRCFLDAHPELGAKHMVHYAGAHHFGWGRSSHHPEFFLLKPTDDPWNMVKHLPECANIRCADICKQTYKVKKHVIDTSIKNGWMLISYLKLCVDENGEPIISSRDKSAINAVIEYLRFNYYRQQYGLTFEAPLRTIYLEAEGRYKEELATYLSGKMNGNLDWLFDYMHNSLSNQIERSYDMLLEGKIAQRYTEDYNAQTHFLRSGRNC